jgi:hypothetical protein
VAVRATRSLPTSQLEISVLAFSVCAFITYLLFWGKPQSIMTPTYLITIAEIPPRKAQRSGTPYPNTPIRLRWFRGLSLSLSNFEMDDRSRIPNDIEYVLHGKTIL